jgi:hyperosmotically inducible protein
MTGQQVFYDDVDVGERRGNDNGRHSRSRNHLRPRRRLRRPLTACVSVSPKKDKATGMFMLSAIPSSVYGLYRLAFQLPSSSRVDFEKEGNMLKRIWVFAMAMAMSASVVTASSGEPRKNLQIYNDISKAVNRYAYFTIFDDVDVAVKDGVVTLTGKVTMPYKRDEIGKRVAKIDGVSEVHNQIGVLPVSQFDDQLRHRIARSIYGNANFSNYAIMANPPIHVIVEHGRVTLTGVVNSDVDRMLARSLATQFGTMSVTNNLKTDAEVREALEKS